VGRAEGGGWDEEEICALCSHWLEVSNGGCAVGRISLGRRARAVLGERTAALPEQLQHLRLADTSHEQRCIDRHYAADRVRKLGYTCAIRRRGHWAVTAALRSSLPLRSLR